MRERYLHAAPAFAGIDTAGRLFSVVGLGTPVGPATTPARSTASNATMHSKNRFMWADLPDHFRFDVVITTLSNAHMLHSSTFADAESPLHGFVYKGKFYLDPQGALCEASAGSSLSQSPQDAVLEAIYAEFGLLHRAAAETQACIVAGHTYVGITANDATTLSQFLMHQTLVQSTNNPTAATRPVIPRRALQVRAGAESMLS